ncbi:MAG: DUF1801 domain-containing protein [Anaerolineales bacterium]
MAELKTRPNKRSVEAFLRAVKDEKRRGDAFSLLGLMREVTGAAPEMWGDSIVGFGRYHYRYESGREGEWFLTGFSPRRQNLTIYIMPGFERYRDLLKKLGKHRTGKSCLYLNSLSEVDLPTLKKLIRQSARVMARSSKQGGRLTS